MRLGLVGVGRIGQFHAGTLRGVDGVDELLIADALPDVAAAVASDLGASAVAHPVELYERGVDGVVVTAATSAHAELIHQALDHGVPVFCEKPVALDIPSTRRVVAHTQASGVAVQIGFQRRFDRGYRAARQALHDGDLGRLHTLRAVTGDRTPPHSGYLPTSGGLFRDCSIHDFDVMRWLCGREVVSVCAMGAQGGDPMFAAAGDVDTCVAILRFEGDVLATVSATRYNGAGHDVRLEVCGDRDTRVVGLDDRAPLPSAEPALSWQREAPYDTFLERFHDAYVAELTAFVEVVAARIPSPCGPEEALQAMYVAEACDRSARSGQPVELARLVAE